MHLTPKHDFSPTVASMAQKKRTVVTLPLGADKNSTLRVMIIWTGSAGTGGA